ncbi:N-acetylmuramoyl-L-alanine amidase [Enterococcus silesiacus]|uniref:N-acetylmuramoyl-L-alanine amidase n=1 Tax=Enterococcus silesiacus TaxID=332949 RepID=A0A0S3KFT0_9ENTE|nr:SH3 domain-containing protein [Enterococcus silesiacus]ALS03108.1 N-acetylmuramoyl-L-alanine amidase [Enterococcus silesiacus]OJG93057.1 N-acetylmuramoyl-L-alanine amidase [Enterococcus silesiacus]
MKKFSKFLLSLIVVTGLMLPMSAQAYMIEQDPIQFSYHPGYASNEIIVLHEAGNPSNVGADSLDREVSFMKRNWQNAYVSYFVGSGGRVKQLAPNGYYQYGAGATGNSKAYAQIELARTNNAEIFKKDYAAYVNLTRGLAKQAGFTFDLDDGTPYGIKTHEWITNNWWGDHTDPYGYLAQWGVSKARLAQDLMVGLPEDGSETTVKPNKPNTPKYKVGQHIRFATIYNTPDDPNEKHIKADQKWTQVGTITQKLNGRKNLYKVENSGKLLGYVNDGDIVEIWNPNQLNTPSKPQESNLVAMNGTFTTNQSLPVSPDATVMSEALAWYDPCESMEYDGYVMANGYAWVSYVDYGGTRRYVAVGPDDGRIDTTWGRGFFN